MHKAVFLDKDGTLIFDVPYNVNPALVKLEDNAGVALKMLQEEGYVLIVVSNQSGVAFGYFSERDLLGVNARIMKLLQKEDVRLNGFYYCPHHPGGTVPEYAVFCECRKPAPGMLLKAAEAFDIDLSQSWMIGDILNDVEAGNRAGCKSILIDNGHETEWEMNESREPYFVAGDIKEAAQFIL